MSGAPVVDRRDVLVRQREQRSLNVTCPYLDGKRTIYITCAAGSRPHKFDISQGLDKDIIFGGVWTWWGVQTLNLEQQTLGTM